MSSLPSFVFDGPSKSRRTFVRLSHSLRIVLDARTPDDLQTPQFLSVSVGPEQSPSFCDLAFFPSIEMRKEGDILREQPDDLCADIGLYGKLADPVADQFGKRFDAILSRLHGRIDACKLIRIVRIFGAFSGFGALCRLGRRALRHRGNAAG